MKNFLKKYFYIKNFNTETNRKKNIVLLISAIFLLLGWVFAGWPYGFYTLLKFVVTLSAIFVTYHLNSQRKGAWVWAYGFIAILYNPIVSIHLPRDIWSVINLFTAIIMVYGIFKIKLDDKNNKGGTWIRID